MDPRKKRMLCASNMVIMLSRTELDEDSSSDDELDMKLLRRTRPRFGVSIRIDRYVENVVHHLPCRQFRAHFRMTRETFEKLLQVVSNELTPFRRPFCYVEKQLLSVIWLLANQESFRSVSDRFDVSKGTLHMYFVRIVNVLNKIAPKIIKWPTGAERSTMQTNFATYGLDNVVGAVDGTYVQIKAPKEDARRYVNRKMFTAITLQAIAGPYLKYIDCFVGYPSSVSDRRIFTNSDIYNAVEQNPERYFDENQYILGDKAYPVKKWCLPPYIDRGSLQIYQNNYNTVHAKTRQVVERSFALLFGRFRRLKYLDMGRVDLIPPTILACCVLHNICLDYEDIDNEYIQEGITAIQATNNNNPNPQIEDAEALGRRDSIARQLFAAQH